MKKAIILILILSAAFFSCDEAIGLFPFPGLGPENLDNPNDLDGDNFLFPVEDNYNDVWIDRSDRVVNTNERIYFSAHISNVYSYRIIWQDGIFSPIPPRPNNIDIGGGANITHIPREGGNNPNNWFNMSDSAFNIVMSGETMFFQVQVEIEPGIYGGISDVGQLTVR